tara:strand:- start:14 stop:151 length:138 start_codon:yes stop_codon:yes gene_type:complete
MEVQGELKQQKWKSQKACGRFGGIGECQVILVAEGIITCYQFKNI